MLLPALLGFEGTMVFVSHDRYFIDRLANKVVHVGDGELEVFPGGYEDFVWSRERRAAEAGRPASKPVSPELRAALSAAKPSPPRRMNPLRVDQLRVKIGTIEEQIESIEENCRVLQLELASSGRNHARRREVLQELEAGQRELQRREDEWAELSEILAAEAL